MVKRFTFKVITIGIINHNDDIIIIVIIFAGCLESQTIQIKREDFKVWRKMTLRRILWWANPAAGDDDKGDDCNDSDGENVPGWQKRPASRVISIVKDR